MRDRAVFLDRDGVINRNRSDYVKSWAEFEFLPGVLDALRRLADVQGPVVVVSNQSIIGRGLASRQVVQEIHDRMVAAVRDAGGRIDAVLFCPHRPDEQCECRKPRPGLLLQAAHQYGVDLSHSFMIGDASSDVMTAIAAGCRPVMVKTGRGAEQLDLLCGSVADGLQVTEDLAGAIAWILEQIKAGARV